MIGILAALSALAPWPGLWLSDLLAAIAPPVAVASALAALAMLATRARRWTVLPLALACSTGAMTLVAPRAPRATGADASIRVLVFNAHASPLPETLDFLRSQKADICVLLEAPWRLFDTSAEDAGYRWRLALGPQTGGPGVRAIFSRWPGVELSTGLADQQVFAVQLDSPPGPVVVVMAHPDSPRTLDRWREGNRRIGEAAAVASRLGAEGTPTFIAADFNSPPTGWRSRMLGRAGFRRARPLWPPEGSYPAWAPAFAGLAIDGVAVGPEFSVVSWRTIQAPVSDHRAVLVELAVTRRPAQ